MGQFVLNYQVILYSSDLYKTFSQTFIICVNICLTYHIIKKKYYICILYDVLRLWQRVRWGLNYPEN